jgi:hypothetical protein
MNFQFTLIQRNKLGLELGLGVTSFPNPYTMKSSESKSMTKQNLVQTKFNLPAILGWKA